MKRLTVLFVLLLFALASGNAQMSDGVEVAVSSGVVLPTSPMTFANYWTVQYGGGVHVGFPLSPSIQLVGSLEHYRFKLNNDGINEGFNTSYMRDIWIFKSVSLNPSADPSTVTSVSANLRFTSSRLTGVLSPYFIAGLGVMRFSLSEIKLPTTSVLSVNGSEIAMIAQQAITGGEVTSAFFQFGVGLDIRLSESFNMFVEARYASGLNTGLRTTYMPITGGMKIRL